MVVFLSMLKVMVLGLASCAFCASLAMPSEATVRVNELFPTEAIFPETDCAGAAACSWMALGRAEPRVVVAGNAQTAAARMRLAVDEKTPRITFFISGPPQI